MKNLNHAKVIQTVDKAVQGKREEFVFEFLKGYGIPAATIKRLKMGDKSRNLAQKEGDLALARELYFRAVGAGEDLAGNVEEIQASPIFINNRIRFILVTDFSSLYAYDKKVDDTLSCELTDLKANYDFFLPLTGKYEKAVAYSEHPADVKACTKMGRLYDSIRAVNHYTAEDLHTLNIFLTRLLFCYFAEDTEIFPEENMMTASLESFTQIDGSDVADFFATLFRVLDMPDNDPQRKSLPAIFRKFPYVNGNIFSETCKSPSFDAKTRRLLIDCGSLKWREISPVIFGSMFQAVMDPELRRTLGAHYTSEENIFKVIRPLFLDRLEGELEAILDSKASPRAKIQGLRKYQDRLASLGFLDPACGSGNFLIVAYRELRRLEIRAIVAIRDLDPASFRPSLVAASLCKISIDQFHGMELQEFPVDIARISLHLMEHVLNLELGKACGLTPPTLPLRASGNVVCANALRTAWEEVVAPSRIAYIFGNPPFGGAKYMSSEQKDDVFHVFHKVNHAGSLDYVTCWFKKSADFMRGTAIQAAFVATNSVCQGTHVGVLWKLLNSMGIHINFAYRTFKWKNNAPHSAAVHCVIVGFGYEEAEKKFLFLEDGSKTVCASINGYLADAEDVFVERTPHPLCDVPSPRVGNQPIDNGYYLFTEEEKNNFLKHEPQAENLFKLWLGGDEFINSWRRYCLWLGDVSDNELKKYPYCLERVEKVREFRLSSKREGTRILAEKPKNFHVENIPSTPYIAIPEVSSERRPYIPIGFITNNRTICSNLLRLVPKTTLYHFGILTSVMHMLWMRTVGGRLEMRYRYSCSIVYNTFPWPDATEDQKQTISDLADGVLAARDEHPDMSLGQMYNPETMPEDLKLAHQRLDAAVDRLYNPRGFASDEERLKTLFAMYARLVNAAREAN